MYSNSLLATLNARKHIRNGVDDTGDRMISLSQVTRETGTNSKTQSGRSQNIAIRIDTQQEYATDDKVGENSAVAFTPTSPVF